MAISTGFFPNRILIEDAPVHNVVNPTITGDSAPTYWKQIYTPVEDVKIQEKIEDLQKKVNELIILNKYLMDRQDKLEQMLEELLHAKENDNK